MAKSGTPRGGNKSGADNRGKKKGLGALKAGSAFKTSNSSAKKGRTAPNGEVSTKRFNYRSESTIGRLNMYKAKAPKGEKLREQSLKPMRIQPDRRWFGNTRVISQGKMQAFRETMAKKVDDPFSVVLRSSKLPMSLLKDAAGKASKMNLLQVEPFNEAFGKRRRQKKPKLGSYDLDGLLQRADERHEGYSEKQGLNPDAKSTVDPLTGVEKDEEREIGVTKNCSHSIEEIFNKGTSKRIWGELYKVVDSSDILVFVLDARDPMGTRCFQLEREIRKSRGGKHIVLLVNKVDLVPTWVTKRWVKELTKEYPTLAFHASITNPFGKSSLLNLLRQFGSLLKERKHVTVGFLGYPNVGKSSVINTMRRKKCVNAAPVPGETKVWQYVALSKKLYLLDCPGIVPPTINDFAADCAKVLKGVVRAERVKCPSDYIDEVVVRVKREYLVKKYKLPATAIWLNGTEFLTIVGKKMGKLRQGGEVDLDITARIVLYDWQRGRIPYFTPPPGSTTEAIGKPTDGQESANEEAKDSEGAQAPVTVGQSFEELACSMPFDKDDRGDDAIVEAHDSDDAEGPQKGEKRGAEPTTRPKKRIRRGKGGSKEAKDSMPGGGTSQLKPGVVDWKAVASEFDA